MAAQEAAFTTGASHGSDVRRRKAPESETNNADVNTGLIDDTKLKASRQVCLQ